MALLGYARVSTGAQDLALQRDALNAAGCLRIFEDTASGALDDRPQLTSLLDHLRDGDTLVVWRLDGSSTSSPPWRSSSATSSASAPTPA